MSKVSGSINLPAVVSPSPKLLNGYNTDDLFDDMARFEELNFLLTLYSYSVMFRQRRAFCRDVYCCFTTTNAVKTALIST